MAWDIETAYARTGIDETPQNDVLLTGAMAATVAIVEMWLNRKLEYAIDTEAFPMVYAPGTLTLRRYPLEEVTGIYYRGDQMQLPIPGSGANIGTKYVLEPDTGLIYFPTALARNSIVVQYSGGYETFPADLELALWLCFDKVWADGFVPDDGATGVGEVSSITVPDVGTVRFATIASATISTAVAGDYNGMIPISAMGMLRPYRRETT